MSRLSPDVDVVMQPSAKFLIGSNADTATNGWRDLVGQALVRKAAGAGVPTYDQIGATPFYAYNFDVTDDIQFIYHIDHDYAEGTPIFLHAHWSTNGTNVQPIVWQFKWCYAHGHQQQAFNFASEGTVTVTQTPTGTAYQHMIAEIAAGIEPTGGFQTDGLLILNLKRITNGGTDNTDAVYLLTGDCHYQANKFSTKGKAPPFNV